MTTQSRNWIITRNFKDGEQLDARQWLSDFYTYTKAKYVVGQLEKGLNELREHIQAYANFTSGKQLGGLKKFCKEMHLEVCRSADASERYCLKEFTRVAGPWEFGEKPLRRNVKADWDEIYLLAKKREFESIPKEILVPHYSNLCKIAKDNMKTLDSNHLRGIFIHGTTGIGKSTLARSLFPHLTHFNKSHNKWFDSYDNESVIIWDDINPSEGSMHATNIKLFTDRYGVKGETKGSGLPLNHEYFIMTSQYSFEEVFSESRDYEALRRRCFVYAMVEEKELGIRTQFSFADMKKHLYGGVLPDIEKFILRDDNDDGDWDKGIKINK